MYDGAELAKAIIANPGDIEAALETDEHALFTRTREVAEMSAQNLQLLSGGSAPRSVVEIFNRPGSPQTRVTDDRFRRFRHRTSSTPSLPFFYRERVIANTSRCIRCLQNLGWRIY